MIKFTQIGANGGFNKIVARLEDLGSLFFGIGDLFVAPPDEDFEVLELVAVPQRRTLENSLGMIAARMGAALSYEQDQSGIG